MTYDDYEGAGRVTRMTLTGGRTVIFGYHPNGNLLSVTPPGPLRQPGQSGQPAQLMTYTAVDPATDVTPTFDYEGFLPTRTEWSGAVSGSVDRSFNHRFGNLLHVTLPDGSSVQYVVDGLGRQVGRIELDAGEHQVDAETYFPLYQDGLRPAALLNAQGELVRRYVYATGKNVLDYFVDCGWDSQEGGGTYCSGAGKKDISVGGSAGPSLGAYYTRANYRLWK